MTADRRITNTVGGMHFRPLLSLNDPERRFNRYLPSDCGNLNSRAMFGQMYSERSGFLCRQIFEYSRFCRVPR